MRVYVAIKEYDAQLRFGSGRSWSPRARELRAVWTMLVVLPRNDCGRGLKLPRSRRWPRPHDEPRWGEEQTAAHSQTTSTDVRNTANSRASRADRAAGSAGTRSAAAVKCRGCDGDSITDDIWHRLRVWRIHASPGGLSRSALWDRTSPRDGLSVFAFEYMALPAASWFPLPVVVPCDGS